MNKKEQKQKRVLRTRKLLKGTSERPRLTIYRSNKNIYAQIIDDTTGNTLASASTLKLKNNNIKNSEKVGEMIAKEAVKKGVKKVVFDRSGNKYHGKIKAVAQAARDNGLDF